MSAIDPDAPIPLYFQLKTLLLEEILEGRYGPGDRLPTEHELCRRFGISRTPVHRALSELSEEGVILRQRRRGTFVNPHWLRRNPGRAELRITAPEGPWEDLIDRWAPDGLRITVATVALPDLHRALTHAVGRGRAPDLAVVDSVWVPEFAAAGFLWDLTELDAAWVDEQLGQFLEPFGRRSGAGTYAVQAEADVAGLWYRLDAVDDPPCTWEELREGLRATGPLAMPAGSRAGETTTYCALALLASNGVEVLDGERVALDRLGTMEALAFLVDLVEEGLLPKEAVAYEWDRPIRLLAEGHAAFALGGSYEAARLAELAGVRMEEITRSFSFVPVPGGPRGEPASLAGGMVYGVFRQGAHPERAMRLLRHLVSPPALADMSLSTGQVPPHRRAVELVAPESPFLASTAALLERSVVRPATPAYARVSAQIQRMVEAALTGRLSPAEAAARTAEMIGAITGLPT